MDTKLGTCPITSNVDCETMSIVEALTIAEKDTIFFLEDVKIAKDKKEFTLKRVAEKTDFGVSVNYNFILESAVTSDSGNSSDKTSECSSDKDSNSSSNAASTAASDASSTITCNTNSTASSDDEEYFVSKLIRTFNEQPFFTDYDELRRRFINVLYQIKVTIESAIPIKNRQTLLSYILKDITYLGDLLKYEQKCLRKVLSQSGGAKGEDVIEYITEIKYVHAYLFQHFEEKFFEKSMVLISSLPMSDDVGLDSETLKAELEEANQIAFKLKDVRLDWKRKYDMLHTAFSLKKLYKHLGSNDKFNQNSNMNKDSSKEESINLTDSEKEDSEIPVVDPMNGEADQRDKDTICRLHQMLDETDEKLSNLEIMCFKGDQSLISIITPQSQTEYINAVTHSFANHLSFMNDGYRNFDIKLKELQCKLVTCEDKVAKYVRFVKNKKGVLGKKIENPVFRMIMEKKMQEHDPDFIFIKNESADSKQDCLDMEKDQNQKELSSHEIFCMNTSQTKNDEDKTIAELEAEIEYYKSESMDYDELLSESKILQNTIEEQNKMIGPFRQKLEFYSLERDLLLNKSEQYEEVLEKYLEAHPEVYSDHGNKPRTTHVQAIITKHHELLQRNKELNQKREELEKKMKDLNIPSPGKNEVINKIAKKTVQNKVKSSPVWSLTIPVEKSIISMPKEEICRKLLYSEGNPSKILKNKFAYVSDLGKELSELVAPTKENTPHTCTPLSQSSTVEISKAVHTTPRISRPSAPRNHFVNLCKNTVSTPKSKMLKKKTVRTILNENQQIWKTV